MARPSVPGVSRLHDRDNNPVLRGVATLVLPSPCVRPGNMDGKTGGNSMQGIAMEPAHSHALAQRGSGEWDGVLEIVEDDSHVRPRLCNSTCTSGWGDCTQKLPTPSKE
mmetsp:Transcript_51463/g.102240  ORF Transcript_51463/g.102240 Transcript_51463/m.102240 type:complete len:109 (-) Transcript_51463:966-1292(-)